VSRRLTAAELAEPDVTIEINTSRWVKLPADVQRDIRAYTTRDLSDGNRFVIMLPAYRWRELEDRMGAT
jgi:hypothetical protein